MSLRARLGKLERARAKQRPACGCGGPGALRMVWHDQPAPGPCARCGAKPIVMRFTVVGREPGCAR